MSAPPPAPALPPPQGGIAQLIATSARHPLWTLLLALAFCALGARALQRAPLDALPDLSDVQVIVWTEWPGQSPDRMEEQVTYPVSSALLATPGVRTVRGQSFLGLSFVYVLFEDDTDLYWARSRIQERLSAMRERLPEGVTPVLGPDATAVGWVFQYALVDHGGTHDLGTLRALQDWQVRYALESVPGVAEVASLGGFERQFRVELDPHRLRAHEVTLREVIQAIRDSTGDAGGRTVELGGHEYMVRGRGTLTAIAELGQVPLRGGAAGNPLTLGEVAEISLGPGRRRGIAELNGEGEVVGGIVLMRMGEDALRVIHDVKARIVEVQRSLPQGVAIQVTYDRSELIRESIDTLKTTLLEEMLVVSLVIFLFLMHARTALVPVLTLPMAVLLSFLPLALEGVTLNVMSLGGIAIAIGAMVDASIILVENVHKRLEVWESGGQVGARREVVVSAMQEVGPSLFFSLAIMTVSFLPVFALEGIEGRLFGPLASTKTYAMGFAALLAVTATPALAALLIRGGTRRREQDGLSRTLIRAYSPVVRLVVRRRGRVVVLACVALAATLPIAFRLGREFMPPLHEGVILYMPSAPPGISESQAAAVLQAMDRELKSFPEVELVFGKMGRAQTATDPAPLGMAETTVLLKPRASWRAGMTWDRLIAEMNDKLRYPGMPNLFWMPIQTRTEMLTTGVRSKVALQLFGDDLASLEQGALALEVALRSVPGTRSAIAERLGGGFYLDIEPRRADAARLGVRVAEVQRLVDSAIGGMAVAETYRDRERIPIQVRFAADFRADPDGMSDLWVTTLDGALIPLREVADITLRAGPPMIRSEGGQLTAFVFIDTERPVADYVRDAEEALSRMAALPAGIRVAFTGQYRALARAEARLRLLVPVTLLAVFALLVWHTGSWRESLLVLLAVPFSLIGAFWLLYALDYSLSVAVWVGLIALMGLDAETGLVMLLYLKIAYRERERSGGLRHAGDLEEAIVEGAAQRIRPKLMTVITTTVGLLPLLWSTGAGADVMKRLAAPMVGGLVSSFLLELCVYPAIFAWWKSASLPRQPD